jgi:hypothetical protein
MIGARSVAGRPRFFGRTLIDFAMFLSNIKGEPRSSSNFPPGSNYPAAPTRRKALLGVRPEPANMKAHRANRRFADNQSGKRKSRRLPVP